MVKLTEKQKQKLIRESVTWTLIEKFSDEMVSKGVSLYELMRIVTFLVVMNADNVFKKDKGKEVLEYIEKVHKSMLDLHRLRYIEFNFISHEKNNTGVES